MNALHIEIYSDLICPWCYIGQKRLRQGLESLNSTEAGPVIYWKPFQLNPGMPAEGMDRRTYRSKKFGTWEASLAMDAEVADVGKSLGLAFNYDVVKVTPNTFQGHRLLWWAARFGKQDQLAEVLFEAYFSKGLNIGLKQVLSSVAASVALPEKEVSAFLDSNAGAEVVVDEEKKGREIGIHSVPVFIINGEHVVPGAQKPGTFVDLFERVLSGGQRCGSDSCQAL